MIHTVTLTRQPGSPHAEHTYKVACSCGLAPDVLMREEAAREYSKRHVDRAPRAGGVA